MINILKFTEKGSAPPPHEGAGNSAPDRSDEKVCFFRKLSQAISKKQRTLIKFVFSTLILVFIFKNIDFGELLKIVKSLSFSWYGLFLVVTVISFFVLSYKWWKILKLQKFRYTLSYIIKVVWIGSFYNLFLPGRVGGDAIKVIYLITGSDKSEDKYKASISIFIDRLYNVTGLLILAYISIILNFRQSKAFLLLLSIMSLFIICVFLIIGFGARLINKTKISKYCWLQKAAGLLESSKHYINSTGRNIFMISGGMLYQISTILSCYLLGRALGIRLPFSYFLFFIPVVYIVTMIPITFGGIGVREGTFIYFLSKAGIPGENALSLSLLLYVSLVLVSSLGYFFQFSSNKSIQVNLPRKVKEGKIS